MTSRAIKQVVTANKAVEGGGFVIRRSVGSSKLSMVDPFLMLDHFGPTYYKPGEAVGAPDHPHRGFETVSYILQGSTQHKDSQNGNGVMNPGDVQWMTAGAGVVHAEMPDDDLMKNGGTMEGFQLWVNLPRKYKMVSPRYQNIKSDQIPEIKLQDDRIKIRIIAGFINDIKAVIDTKTQIVFLDIHLTRNVQFSYPLSKDYNGFIYVYRGQGKFGIDNVSATEGQALEFAKDGDCISLQNDSSEPCKLLLLAGIPINEPIARYGPFVMNTNEEIQQAFADYRAGKMGSIEGAEDRSEATRKALEKSGGPIGF
ncbi:unnamed protein product [Didymodactylos carnosus]|uniref:Pirin n=1 Tax=Didymodactylos carnosus TaxID=1234261 RepID=A0A815B6P8_9BILA|nr:unnamed protein product [Didymodactylos carnosus]CAF1369365.1 unnamed protein product [Didymodactylos carnosus]CAF4050164.1 unnamed protein product [Didymodactylos carnosus]CAF4178565.1 unnamed protein product [Didymodactylos carnosus]